MHIKTIGQGPDITLIHGWAMHGGIFHHLAERLSQHARVHMVDLPGHGLSRDLTGLEDLRDCADRIARLVPPSIWIAWSMGGLFAIRAALDHPEQVHALGLIACSPQFTNDDHWSHGVSIDIFKSFAEDLSQQWQKTVDRFLALEVNGDEFRMAGLRELRARLFSNGEPNPDALIKGLELLQKTSLRNEIARLTCPTMWIAGARDQLVDWRAMQWAAQATRGEFRMIERAGHAPFITHLDAVLECIDQLRREVELQ